MREKKASSGTGSMPKGNRSFGYATAAALSLGAAACAPAAPPIAEAPEAGTARGVAQAPAPRTVAAPEPKLRGHLTVDAVSLGAARLDGAGIVSTVQAKTKDLVACLHPAPSASTDVWIVGRANDGGAVDAVNVVSDVDPNSAACFRDVLNRVTFADSKKLAFSIVMRAEPAPSQCRGDDCVYIPIPGEEQKPPATAKPSAAGADDEPTNARGNMWGDAIPDSFGAGGLGTTGTGEGGGGIGLGSIGTLGHGAGAGTGQGFGNGNGRLTGSREKKPPSIRMGATKLTGALPPEVIQRIVRQNFGRFRLCYESELRKDPNLAGLVTTSFEIQTDGSVANVKATTALPATLATCMESAFKGLSFPEPTRAIRIGGKNLSEATADDASEKLEKAGWRTAVVKGATPDAPFAIFAIKSGESMDPLPKEKTFLTSVRRQAEDPSHAQHDIAFPSDGAWIAFQGPSAASLASDLVEREKGIVRVTYPISFSPGG